MAEEPIDKHPWRTLAFCLATGSSFFVALLLVVHLLLISTPGFKPDPSAFNFYPVMALIGALFGFERWWTYEQGPMNPFHESRYY